MKLQLCIFLKKPSLVSNITTIEIHPSPSFDKITCKDIPKLDYNTKNLLELQNYSSMMLLTHFVNRWQMNITAEC